MKKAIVGSLTLLMLLGCCTLVATATVTDIGTVKYFNLQENFLIVEGISGNANLTYAYSEINESALKAEKVWFDTGSNNTTYKFVTSKIFVPWWFTGGLKDFIFIDENTNNIYRIQVNYSDIDIPENPFLKQYDELFKNHSLLEEMFNLSEINLSYFENEFEKVSKLYNTTLANYNLTKEEKDNLTILYNNAKNNYDNAQENVSYYKQLWLNESANASTYQLWNDDANRQLSYLQNNFDDMEGSQPWYICLSIIGACLFSYVWINRRTISKEKIPINSEIETGYGEKQKIIDKWALTNWFKKEKLKPQKNPQEMDAIHQKIDENNRATNKQIENLTEKIEAALKAAA